MANIIRLPAAGALALVLATAVAASAQDAASAPPDTATVQLVYEREVFSYEDRSRRDPFRPLTDGDAIGPRYEDLTLQGVIYSTGRGQSLALIGDATGRVYRVRVGDRVGNSRVLEIGPLRVVLAVENFGVVRHAMLELQQRGENQ